MFDHVTIRVSDCAATRKLYDTVLATIGIEGTDTAWGPEWDDFSMSPTDDDHPAVTTGLHVGFVAPSHDRVRAFWRAGLDAGLRDDGEPGPRREYRDDYFGGFLLDPDGNSIEAVHHGGLRTGGNIDHLWIRVADLAASRAFYDTIAPAAGFSAGDGRPDRVHYVGATGSFSIVADERPPTRNLHLAFPAETNAAVEAFHRAAVAAGHRDNGEPGERPIYHPGYYAAFVLDPDGNNIELVSHDGRGSA